MNMPRGIPRSRPAEPPSAARMDRWGDEEDRGNQATPRAPMVASVPPLVLTRRVGTQQLGGISEEEEGSEEGNDSGTSPSSFHSDDESTSLLFWTSGNN